MLTRNADQGLFKGVCGLFCHSGFSLHC